MTILSVCTDCCELCSFPSSPVLVPQALPQHFPLKHARFTLELENHGQHALQDAQAVQGLPDGAALRTVAAFDVSRREIDGIQRPGSYDAKEDRDIVGRSYQRLMEFLRITGKRIIY
jgi:hypothetical protein